MDQFHAGLCSTPARGAASRRCGQRTKGKKVDLGIFPDAGPMRPTADFGAHRVEPE